MRALEHERITAAPVQRNKHLQQFNYIVSHNLRAPVANIIGLTGLLAETESPAYKFQLMAALSNSVHSLDGIIRDLNKILTVREPVNEKKETVYFKELADTIAG